MYVWSQVSDAASKSLDETLGEVAKAGYDGVEMNRSHMEGTDKAAEVRSLLDKYNLKLSSVYSGGTFHESGTAGNTVSDIFEVAAFAAELGSLSITVNPASKGGGAEKTDDELKIQAEYLDKMGSKLKTYNMSFFIHNHTPEMVSNAREFRSYCDLTNPDFVNVCMDVHWVLRGGVDPFQLTEEYGDRVGAMHVRNSKDGVWMEEFSDGDIDYRAYRDLLKTFDYDGWVTVELAYEKETNPTRPLVEDAKISREYVREVFGV